MKRHTVVLAAAPLLVLALASCPLVQFELTVYAFPESGPAPLTVEFWASVGELRHADTCEWDFGDGSPAISMTSIMSSSRSPTRQPLASR